jgi:hypothetical protein
MNAPEIALTALRSLAVRRILMALPLLLWVLDELESVTDAPVPAWFPLRVSATEEKLEARTGSSKLRMMIPVENE